MINQAISFSSSPTGLVMTGALAVLVIVTWDWRIALVALLLIQGAIGAATVSLSQVPAEWVLIQTAVMGLACLILGISAAQAMRTSPSSRQAGSTWLRVMAVLMLYGGWRLLDITVSLPATDPGVAQLYGWLALSAFLLLALGANPLFAGVAILMWIVIVQAFVASVLEIPSLVALVGILELLVALACSYLLVAEWQPTTRERPILTDVAFPTQTSPVEASFSLGSVTEAISSRVARGIAQRLQSRSADQSGHVAWHDESDRQESPSDDVFSSGAFMGRTGQEPPQSDPGGDERQQAEPERTERDGV